MNASVFVEVLNFIILGLFVIIPLSAVVRLALATFSPKSRRLMLSHPVVHKIWFAAGILILCLDAMVLASGWGERDSYVKEHKHMLNVAADDFARYGYVTNVSSSADRFWLSTNVVTIGGSKYVCYAEVGGGQFGNEGTLAITTYKTFIWLSSNGPPKIMGSEYKPGLFHF